VDLFSSMAVLLLFTCAACAYIGGTNTAEHQKVYSVIEDRYVVLHQNASNYYTVVTYEDINGEVILDTTIQKVIPVENVEIQRDLLEPDMIILAE